MRKFIYKNCPVCNKQMELTPTKAHKICCSLKCHQVLHPVKKGEVKCVVCDKLFQQKRVRDKLCSKECLYQHRSKSILSRRSKFEGLLSDAIKQAFPSMTVIDNDRTMFSGLEIDIWIPDIKLAIEWNGPFHYKPIFGMEDLLSQQKRDVRKLNLANALNIHLIVIPAAARMTKTLFEPIKNDILKLIADIKLAYDASK